MLLQSNEMTHHIIETEADIRKGVRALVRGCEHMARVHDVTGLPPLRRRANGFEGLARIIVGQQLSVASAAAIWGRVEQTVRPFDAGTLMRKRDATLRKCGLSAGKIRTLRTIAGAISKRELDLVTLSSAEDDVVKEALVALTGVGPWTADIYLMFCLGRADGWAPGDLALRYAVQDACALDDIPDENAMIAIAERWRPWRGVAARMLWAYYGIQRAQKQSQPA